MEILKDLEDISEVEEEKESVVTESPRRDKAKYDYKPKKQRKLQKKMTQLLDSGAPRFRPHKISKHTSYDDQQSTQGFSDHSSLNLTQSTLLSSQSPTPQTTKSLRPNAGVKASWVTKAHSGVQLKLN